jgi:acyl dehydratase
MSCERTHDNNPMPAGQRADRLLHWGGPPDLIARPKGTASMVERYYEDYSLGEVVRASGYTFTEAAITDWGLRYDPQYIHLDKPAAEKSIYGGLIASGWQIGSISFRLLVQAGLLGEASLGSPGVDELRWLLPVRPGDTIYPVAEIVAMRVSASKPERGLVTIAYRVENQRGETVCTMRALQIVKRREA